MRPGSLYIQFSDHVEMDEVRGTLSLARALEPAAQIDLPGRRVALDPSSTCGRDFATLFFGFCRREFGAAAVRFDGEGE